MRKILIALSVLLLTGCAGMGVSPDNPELQSASQSAQAALDKAREVGAKSNRPREFQELVDRYNALYQEHQAQPKLQLVEKYQAFERNAYETAIGTLRGRFEQLDSRVSKLQTQLEKRVSTLENDKAKLKSQIQELTERTNKLKQDKKGLRQDLKNLRKKRQSLAENKKTFQNRLEGFRQRITELKTQLNQSDSTIRTLRTRLEDRDRKLTDLQQENKQVQSELNQRLEEGDVRRRNDRVYIALESRILFNLGDVHVRNEIQGELNQIAGVLKKYPDRQILVEGHTDDLPLKNELAQRYGSNWELSAQRAINVLKYFVYNRGISKERIGAVAYGQFRPRVPNTSTENRAMNRRVEIVLLPSEVPEKTRELVGE